MAKKMAEEEYAWSPFQLEIMRMVQRHPVTYVRDFMITPAQYRAALTSAWDRISRDLLKSQRVCAHEWSSIMFRYAKVNNMMHNGQVEEEIIKLHPKTSKYMDGSLDFMDGYIDEIDDDEIPLAFHKRFNKMFGLSAYEECTIEMVLTMRKRKAQERASNETGKMQVQHLMKIAEKAVDHALRQMHPPEESQDYEEPEESAAT